jgi:hypothetical protein
VGWHWVHLVRRPLTGLLYQPQKIDNDECGAVGGMWIGKAKRNTRRKPALVPLRLSIYLSIYLSVCGSTALMDLGRLFSYLILCTVGRTPWTGDQPVQGRYLHTEQHKHRINAHTDINTLSGIGTHNPSVRTGEDGSCLRQRDHCDWPSVTLSTTSHGLT